MELADNCLIVSVVSKSEKRQIYATWDYFIVCESALCEVKSRAMALRSSDIMQMNESVTLGSACMPAAYARPAFSGVGH